MPATPARSAPAESCAAQPRQASQSGASAASRQPARPGRRSGREALREQFRHQRVHVRAAIGRGRLQPPEQFNVELALNGTSPRAWSALRCSRRVSATAASLPNRPGVPARASSPAIRGSQLFEIGLFHGRSSWSVSEGRIVRGKRPGRGNDDRGRDRRGLRRSSPPAFERRVVPSPAVIETKLHPLSSAKAGSTRSVH